jgi:competence protein ComEA
MQPTIAPLARLPYNIARKRSPIKIGGKSINEALARHRYVVFLILTLAMAGAVGYGLMHRPRPLVLTVLPPQPTSLPTPKPTAAPVRCHVVGAVRTPGVYTLPPGALVQDAVLAAGGPSDDADLERLNLATVIQDQEQIIVPEQSAALRVNTPGTIVESDGGLVNINTADSERLQTLPRIGPVLAGRIIDYRDQHGPFAAVDDLTLVKGIGEATLERLRPLTTVGP